MIRELHEKLTSGGTTSIKLTEEYFDIIKKKNNDLNAYLTITKDEAMRQAEAVDKKIKSGQKISLVEGIPGAVKDNICLKDTRTTAASKVLDNYISPYDATVITKLKENGAVFLGKTNLDEFAMGSSTENSAYFPTKNPNDPDRVPGGSSGGSAAAVASDMAVWALGTDTGGSIRQPSSFCGTVGLKPTYGRVSRYGAIAMASSLDQIGPITRTVEDAAIILSVISGRDKMDATTAPDFGKKYEDYLTGDIKGLKVGIIREYLEKLGEREKKVMESVIDSYEKMGAEIVEIELPYDKFALPTYYIIQPSEVSSNLARYDGVKFGMRMDDSKNSNLSGDDAGGDWGNMPKTLLETYLDTRQYGLGAEVKRRIMLGTYALSSGYYEAYYLRAQKVRTLIKKDFEKAFKTVDLVLTPTAPTAAFRIGEKTESPLEMYLADIFTITANIAGIPAISVPTKNGIRSEDKTLPFGFQLMGKWFDEETLLRSAEAYERMGA